MRLIKERTVGAGSGAAASNCTTRLHYLSLHSAPFNLFFNGVSPRKTNRKAAYSTDFCPKGLRDLNLFLIFHMDPDKISIVKRK